MSETRREWWEGQERGRERERTKRRRRRKDSGSLCVTAPAQQEDQRRSNVWSIYI